MRGDQLAAPFGIHFQHASEENRKKRKKGTIKQSHDSESERVPLEDFRNSHTITTSREVQSHHREKEKKYIHAPSIVASEHAPSQIINF